MSQTPPVEAKPPVRVWRRVGTALGVVVAGTMLLGYFGNRYDFARTTGALRNLEQQLDEDDPNWRLMQIEAHRELIPEEENSARVIVQIGRMTPRRTVTASRWDRKEAARWAREVSPPTLGLRVYSSRLLGSCA